MMIMKVPRNVITMEAAVPPSELVGANKDEEDKEDKTEEDNPQVQSNAIKI